MLQLDIQRKQQHKTLLKQRQCCCYFFYIFKTIKVMIARKTPQASTFTQLQLWYSINNQILPSAIFNLTYEVTDLICQQTTTVLSLKICNSETATPN
jgi:hypothetical protein